MDNYNLNFGDKTTEFLNNELYAQIDSEDFIKTVKMTLKTLNSKNIFLEKLMEVLKTNDIKEIKSILKKGFVEKRNYNEKQLESLRKKIDNWFNKDTEPSMDISHRKDVYDLCYVLGMNLDEAAEFIIKGIRVLPFNFKIKIDVIYYYCFNNDDFSELDYLLNYNYEGHTNEGSIQPKQLNEIDNKDDLITYISVNCKDNNQIIELARNKFSELKNSIINNKASDLENPRKLYDKLFLTYYKKKNDSNVDSYAGGLKRVSYDLPTQADFSNDYNDNPKASLTGLRKAILSLYIMELDLFLQNNADVYIDPEEKVIEIDNELVKIGLQPLYPRNPFDAAIIYCIYQSLVTEDDDYYLLPLYLFQSIFNFIEE